MTRSLNETEQTITITLEEYTELRRALDERDILHKAVSDLLAMMKVSDVQEPYRATYED